MNRASDSTEDDPTAATTGYAGLGRVVMIVDNGVRGDSRVQKEARSMAARGWEVHLVGSHKDPPEQWTLGGATVHVLQRKFLLTALPYRMRRAPLRAPLAYRPGRTENVRRNTVRAWRADLRDRRKQSTVLRRDGAAPGRFDRLGRDRLRLERRAAELLGWWVALRSRQTTTLDERRRQMDGRLDRFTTAFWHRVLGDRAWRRLDPSLWDYEFVYGRYIDELQPDIIHANDFRMTGVGARAKRRAQAAGRDVRLVWDAHEFLPAEHPNNRDPRWHLAQVLNEREHVHEADAVVTVSDTLAGMLVDEYGFAEKPAVVTNAPILPGDIAASGAVEVAPAPSVRVACGVGPDVPILVYSGGVSAHRGVHVMVEALGRLSDVHVALIAPPAPTAYSLGLLDLAAELGAADRLHVLPYAAPEHVVEYVSSADIGVHPTHHWPNHEISLATKFFEYAHARLPIIVSDVKEMSEQVRRSGMGEVFVAEDLDDFVRAVRAVLADPKRYRSVYDDPGLLDGWTWERQADELHEVYRRQARDRRPS